MIEEPTKHCARCRQNLPVSEFTAAPRMRSGLKSYCRKCCLVDARERLEKDRERINARVRAYRRRTYTTEQGRRRHLQQMYGLSIEQYDQILAAQDGTCAVCKTNTPGGKGDWHVDHCHTTGRVRGLLCASCNVGIAQFGDDVTRLAAAITYLNQQFQEQS